MNWTVLGAIIATFSILLVFKEHSKRLAVDHALKEDKKEIMSLDNPAYMPKSNNSNSKNESDI